MIDEIEPELEINEFSDTLAHIGVLRKSGRFPWGSGENPYQRSSDFLAYVADLRKQGLTDTQIAKGIGEMSIADGGKDVKTTEFRAVNKMAKDEVKKADIARALMLRDKGMSNVAIGKAMGKPESTVREYLKENADKRISQLDSTISALRQNVDEKKFLDVGVGIEHDLMVSDTQVKTAVASLREEGYNLYYLKQPQLGTNHETTLKVLTPADVTYKDLLNHRDEVRSVSNWIDNENNVVGLRPPAQVDPKRVMVRYGSEGGSDLDGVIELRRGIADIDLGDARYAQVRIAVDGGKGVLSNGEIKKRYLKGMAIYADDLPDGIDFRFNTNKQDKGDKLLAMKPQSLEDPTNPFGSSIKRQKIYFDEKGKEKLSPINIVNEEGDWTKWSSKLSSQFLSKQSPVLAKDQLGVRYDSKVEELNQIKRLTNPEVRKKLLDSFADDADSSAVHLKAAGLPRTKTHVILPINSMKDNEIYAPKYENGEVVVLVRHPHGGKFEIPQLIVNNRNKDAKRLIQNADDAVGINAKVAARLSGADFDGDTVLVIPNGSGRVKTSPALDGLKGFDPQTYYPGYEGMKVMSGPDKQHKMGDISNLITDMTIKGATPAELARAVRHSMVVIDAEKHKLNYKQSYKDNNIVQLKMEYQNGPKSGATTLISQASSRIDVNTRKERPAKEGGFIDKETGEKNYVDKGETYEKRTVRKDGTVKVEVKNKTIRSTKMAEVKDARDLISDARTPIEMVYADYANKLKALANNARKEMVNTPPVKINNSAKEMYKAEVASLKAKLNTALKNAPLERQAQVLANAQVKQKMASQPDMDAADLKKIKGQALTLYRERVGAHKTLISITDGEWDAMQNGAVSANVLQKILNNTDMDKIKERATPRSSTGLPASTLARARSLLSAGYTQAEVAGLLGVSTSTLGANLKEA